MKVGIYLNKYKISSNNDLRELFEEIFELAKDGAEHEIYIYFSRTDQNILDLRKEFKSSCPMTLSTSFLKPNTYCPQTATHFHVIFQEIDFLKLKKNLSDFFFKSLNEIIARYIFKRDNIELIHTIGHAPLIAPGLKQVFTPINKKRVKSKNLKKVIRFNEEQDIEKNENCIAIKYGAKASFVHHIVGKERFKRIWLNDNRLPSDYILIILSRYNLNLVTPIISKLKLSSEHKNKALVFVTSAESDKSLNFKLIKDQIKSDSKKEDASIRKIEREIFFFNRVFSWQIPALIDCSSLLVYSPWAEDEFNFHKRDLDYLGKNYFIVDPSDTPKKIKDDFNPEFQTASKEYKRTMRICAEQLQRLYKEI